MAQYEKQGNNLKVTETKEMVYDIERLKKLRAELMKRLGQVNELLAQADALDAKQEEEPK